MLTDTHTLPGNSHKWWRDTQPEAFWPVYEEFRSFLCYIWAELGLPRPTPVQLDMADYLQYGPRRRIMEAFRGVGKSWITAAFVCWLLLRDKDLKIMVVSASKERADNFTTFTLQLLATIPLLQHLYPEPGQRESKVAFDVRGTNPDQAPSVRSVGVTGQMTGGRADIIVSDDVEVPKNSETVVMRAKLAERVKEYDAILKPNGHVVYLGTPQTEESLYNKMPERGYAVRIWPARFPSPEKREGYGAFLAPMIAERLDKNPSLVNKPTDPHRFNELDLVEREASYGRTGFALQFMLDTTLSDAERYPLKLSDLLVESIDPIEGPERIIWASGPQQVVNDLPLLGFNGDYYHRPMDYHRDQNGNVVRYPYTGKLLTIDPSGRGKDETAYNITYMLNSTIFVPEAGAFRDGYSEKTLTALAEAAKRHKVKAVLIESNFGDGMFAEIIKPYFERIYPCTVEEKKVSGMKEARIIDTLEPVMNQHRLVIDPKVIEEDYRSVADLPQEEASQYRLFYQLTHITRLKGALVHDDRVDALSLAVGYWVEQMGLDQEKRIKVHREKALDAELRKFMTGLGVKTRNRGNTRRWTSNSMR